MLDQEIEWIHFHDNALSGADLVDALSGADVTDALSGADLVDVLSGADVDALSGAAVVYALSGANSNIKITAIDFDTLVIAGGQTDLPTWIKLPDTRRPYFTKLSDLLG